MAERFISLLIGYGSGCFLTADIVVKRKEKKSVFEVGTGNPGMANVMKQFGFRAGAMVLGGDLLKTVIAVLTAYLLFGHAAGRIIILYAVLGCTIGHNWPAWHHFSGGKGVSVTCMGIFLYLPGWGLLADIAGMLVVFSTGYLPLGAVVITALYTVFAFAFAGAEAGVLALVLALIMLQRHWPGVIGSIRGTEPKNAQLFKRRSGS